MRPTRLVALLLLFHLIALATAVQADEFRAEASVDRNVVGVGERLVLTIRIYGGGQVSEPDMGTLEGFTIVNTSRSQTLSIVNFDAVRSLVLQYVMMAASEGEYVLGPFKVQSGKEIYETEPLKVTVVKGQAPPPSAQQPRGDDDAVLVRASVDKSRAYVGEQITYNLQFAYRVRPRDVQYTPPDHTGFWTEEIGETGPSVETIDGRRYYVVNKRTAFFPISGGNFTIGEASLRYRVSELRPFSFDPFDMNRGREGTAVTRPVDIVVRPLPAEGKPANFTGAVGKFSLHVSPSSREVRTGESLTLSVRISGRGNVKSIGDIDVPDLEGFRVFAPKARETIDKQQSQVGGEKVFDLVLVPEQPGEQVIEGFEFSYFDPQMEQYVMLTADPIDIAVVQGDEPVLTSVSGESPGGVVARKDIRYIKRVDISKAGLGLSTNGVEGLLIKFAPVLFAVVGLVVSVQRRRAAVSGKGAIRRAYRSAMLALKAARETARREDRIADASSSAARALRLYLATRVGTSEALIDQQVISSLTGIGEDTKAELAGLVASLDRIRFAPVGAEVAEVTGLIDRAEALIKNLNTGWKI